jgi:hypothetical protein
MFPRAIRSGSQAASSPRLAIAIVLPSSSRGDFNGESFAKHKSIVGVFANWVDATAAMSERNAA